MLLHKLRVRNFRLFEDQELSLERGVNLILGNNAVGKTTLLEAIYLLVTGSSFRALQPKEMVRKDAFQCHVELHFTKADFLQKLSYSFSAEEKRVKYNGNPLTSATSLLGLIQAVLLAPQDIDLIRGSPALRRHYLDVQLSQVDPLYVHHLIRYKKALKQRNYLLRQKKVHSLCLFEASLAQSAAYIVGRRRKVCDQLETRLAPLYESIAGRNEKIALHYQGEESPTPERFLEHYAKSRQRELDLGYTLAGPHKDDLQLFLNGKEARLFASEGEMRTLAMVLKLAEWQAIHEEMEEPPLLLLDDFGLSLDIHRLQALSKHLSGLGQVIITSPSKEHRDLFGGAVYVALI